LTIFVHLPARAPGGLALPSAMVSLAKLKAWLALELAMPGGFVSGK